MPNFNGKLKRAVLALADIILVGASLYLALVLRFEGVIPARYMLTFERLLRPIILINLIIFLFSGLYRRLWRYASVDELLFIFMIVWAGAVSSYLYSVYTDLLLPRSVYVIFLCLLLFLLGGSRFFLRFLADYLRRSGTAKDNAPVLILGAGDAGVLVSKEFKKHQAQQGVRVVGFIDDDPSKQGQVIQGFPVLGTRNDLRRIVENKKISQIVVAMPSVPYSKLREIIELCGGLPVKIKTVPGVYEILEGKVSLQQLKEVEIEDLLQRPPVERDMGEIAGYLEGRVIMVTGAGGSIGAELCRQLAQLGIQKLALLDQSENDLFSIEWELRKNYPQQILFPLVRDIQDRPSLKEVFAALRPEVIFHAAAYKHVPLMETNPKEAVKNNVLGSKNLLDLALQFEVERFVAISTDKAVKPTSVMGATKRAVEIYMQHLAHRDNGCAFCAVRFGNVLGSRGSVVPIFRKQIAEGGPVTITHPEMTRYFMTIPEAVQLVIQAGAFGKNGEIFVLDMGEPVKVVDLARDMIVLSGLQPGKDIKIEFIGIRPGGKLTEALFNDRENFLLTKHRRIFVAPDVWNDKEGKIRDAELCALGRLLGENLHQLL
ncbi:MAG: polysaccharide biosynthesis protein, partial [Firmicutes bacterium]|nr:polysaccharide biosynthesis protein [Bacillota bacterium]